ncbi:MAG: tRNA uridine-5-carboxymethylaminomethyl(34) synthesis GTPase MnmE [Caulobacteraceae bacterium]|jgi:tRNA modification GTPase|nr:tRNA uridine-5-carboxymethylaminomethyl(34) synthesis GTPase MnmE [Caulobacteraceae bacterium]
MTDTIFALATAPGRAAVAVVRLSGPGTRAILAAIGGAALKPRTAALRTLTDPAGESLDRALVLWFPGPASYTGEDCGELHVHGAAAVVDGVMAALTGLGARLAEPGEFTRRAFENGKLDLDQAEAVADLVNAETAAQARQAVAQLGGSLGDRYKAWRRQVTGILARLEAAVDFPDEEVPAEVRWQARAPLEALIGELDEALADGARGRRVREGYRVAIIGAPNAGKSSFFNVMLRRDAAIVTATPGATRDVIEAPLRIGGYSVVIADMAGLRESGEPIEAEGVRRARAWAAAADLRIWVIDRAAQDDAWEGVLDLLQPHDLCLINKADLVLSPAGVKAAATARRLGLETATASLCGGDGGAIWAILSRRVTRDLTGTDFPATTRARHARHLSEARDNLARAAGMLDEPELAAEDVRLAARSLRRVTGEIGVEDVLGEVFASFCIGK